MSYVVLRPYSNTNDTNRFRVVEFADWAENGESGKYKYEAFDIELDAYTEAHRLNNNP